ncbi:hypothetical protein WMY93_027159 [Mugilogobius chulae]|uniref:Sugar phosphate transporter domain-containing protein n=1 Tax=Mugilogobius chulae TaxID=88201 RepID=A0AAW0MVG8_9GOBI
MPQVKVTGAGITKTLLLRHFVRFSSVSSEEPLHRELWSAVAVGLWLMGPGGLVLTSPLLWALGHCPVAAGGSAPGADSSSDDAAFGPSVPSQLNSSWMDGCYSALPVEGAAHSGPGAAYYLFSIGITFYNKWLMKDFHYPLFMTLVHLSIIFVLSSVTRWFLFCATGKPRVTLSWKIYLWKVAPTAVASALDIGLSNWSFLYITISLYTMTKSSAVLFILFFSLIFKLEEPNWFLVLVVLLISSGLFMFTYKSTQFNLEGFILVLLASFLGGIRWTLTQLLMQKSELGLQNPIDAMFHLQPLMFLGLFPLFLFNEGVMHTVVSRRLMGDRMTLLNWLGFVVCLSGISLHVGVKVYYSKNKSVSVRQLNNRSSELELPLLLSSEEVSCRDREVTPRVTLIQSISCGSSPSPVAPPPAVTPPPRPEAPPLSLLPLLLSLKWSCSWCRRSDCGGASHCVCASPPLPQLLLLCCSSSSSPVAPPPQPEAPPLSLKWSCSCCRGSDCEGAASVSLRLCLDLFFLLFTEESSQLISGQSLHLCVIDVCV